MVLDEISSDKPERRSRWVLSLVRETAVCLWQRFCDATVSASWIGPAVASGTQPQALALLLVRETASDC